MNELITKLIRAIYTGVWLFGIAALCHAIAPHGLVH